MQEYMHLVHTNAPVWNKESEVLILGTFPSVKSRESRFFYGHPQNRFWKVIAYVLSKPVPTTVEEKKQLLIANKIALWDVIASCDIAGSSDSSIKNVVPNDVGFIINNSNVKSVFTNGTTAAKLYDRYLLPTVGIEPIKLPSTSPANASWDFKKLCDVWSAVGDRLKQSGR